jgi:hypothetical protein
VPIQGANQLDCFKQFREHLGALIARVFSPGIHVGVIPSSDGSIATVGFRQGGIRAAPLETRYGQLFFYLAQELSCAEEPEEPANRRYRLQTVKYWYRLQESADIKAQAVIRWEYVRSAPSDGYCRHHVQIPSSLSLGNGEMNLNKAHLPCGWVTIEEVLRFLIVDLGFSPPCGRDWPTVLSRSEAKFFKEFTGKRYTPPGGE